MKYFFILGRNPELSRAEIYRHLESRSIGFSEIDYEENILILDVLDGYEFNIEWFGGVISFGKLKEFKNEREFGMFLEENEFIELDKFTYSVIGNMDSFVFSEKFKREKKKARIKNFGKKLKFQSGDSFFLPNVDVEIFAKRVDSKIYLGEVLEKFNSREVEMRDMEKPVRREGLAISPRLSKILINLAGLERGENMLDPFCGVGGIVQEAVLMGVNAIGIDRDRDAITGAKMNLAWLKENFEVIGKYDFINKNSLNAENKQYDGIVCESSLGDLLKKRLKGKNAKTYIDKFLREIIPLLKKFKEIKKKDAKIVITFPCFEGVEISEEEIVLSTGLSVYSDEFIKFPIVEKRKNQFVNRQIWVFH